MKSDVNVPNILKGDKVTKSTFDKANQEIASISELISLYGRSSSWSHALINTESNSATLICQLPGEGNRRHYHPDWNEWWFIVEGEWEWEISGEKKYVKKGDIVYIEKNKKHKVKAIGDRCAIRLAVSRYDVEHIYENEDYIY